MRKGFIFAPFDQSDQNPRLWIGADQAFQENDASNEPLALDTAAEAKYNQTDLVTIDRAAYLATCQNFIDTIRSGQLDKAIFSRIKRVTTAADFDVIELFAALERTYPDAFVYVFSHPTSGIWLGATPESLVVQKDNLVETMALAGTRRGTDIEAPWGTKEIQEQAIVADFIREQLQLHAGNAPQEKGPYTATAGPVQHLCTSFKSQSKLTADLIHSMHPTPATCGLPKQAAKDFILQTEAHDRAYYTGYLGPTAPKQTKLFVNLRCLKAVDHGLALYLGGGITAGSDPEKEWTETELKSKTLLSVIEKM